MGPVRAPAKFPNYRGTADLNGFLFGSERNNLALVRPALLDIQRGRCPVVADGRIHVLAGADSNAHQVYEPALDSWSVKRLMPCPESIGWGMAAVYKDKIYFFAPADYRRLGFVARPEDAPGMDLIRLDNGNEMRWMPTKFFAGPAAAVYYLRRVSWGEPQCTRELDGPTPILNSSKIGVFTTYRGGGLTWQYRIALPSHPE